MSEHNSSVQDGMSTRRGFTRRLRRGRDTRVDSEAVKEERDRQFRARMKLKINDAAQSDQPEEDLTKRPTIQGKGRTEEWQKLIEERKLQGQTRIIPRPSVDKAIAEKARAKPTEEDRELLKDPPEAKQFEADLSETGIPETEIAEKPVVAEKLPEGTVLLPRKTSNRARRSVILKVDGSELVKPSGSQRLDADGTPIDEPKRTRLAFKVLGVMLVLFFGAMCYRWIAKGKAPTDLVTVEGQHELANETAATVSWATHDLKKFLGGSAPETEDDSVRLVEESKQQLAGDKTKEDEKHAIQKAVPPPIPNVLVAPKKTPVATPGSKTPTRTAEPAPRYFADKNPGLNAARDLYNQANVYHAKSDPRVAEFSAVQKNIRLAVPLFERCLDECAKARQRGVRGNEVDILEQAAAMRLYDCRKRETVNP